MKNLALTFLLLVTNYLCKAGNSSIDTIPTHPCLFVTTNTVAQTRQAITLTTWKQQAWQVLQKNADQFLFQPLDIPTRGGNWEQNYINPKNGNELVRGKQIGNWQWQHIDTSTKEIFLGDSTKPILDYDGVVISLAHDAWAIGALQLGFAYQINQNIAYATKAKEILLAYATLYPKLKIRNKNYGITKGTTPLGNGKIQTQNLNEALWLIDIVQATDLIWNTLSNDNRDSIILNILNPATDLIINSKPEISNIQCWKNAAIGMVGFLTQNNRFINIAMQDTAFGYKAQLTKGFSKEGWCIDMSPTYHFYTLNAIILLAQAAKNFGYAIDNSLLYPLFIAPLQLANNGVLPAFNDSKTVTAGSRAYLYEWGYMVFNSTQFLTIIQKSNRVNYTNVGPTFTGWSLFFGVDSLPRNTVNTNTNNVHFTDAGIAKLKVDNTSNSLTAYFKYNNQLSKRAHFHNAQLDFTLMAARSFIAPMAGIENYASPLANGWYRTSLAHNTLVVNGKTQQPSSTTLIASGEEKSINYIMAKTNDAYDSTQFIRTLILVNNNLAVVADQITCTKKGNTILDFAYHPAGKWQSRPMVSKWQNENKKTDGYGYITDGYIGQSDTAISYITTLLNNVKPITVSAIASEPYTIITGYAPSINKQATPLTIYRMNTNKALLIYCIALNGKKVAITLDTLKDSNNKAIPLSQAFNATIIQADGSRTNFSINPDKLQLSNAKGMASKAFSIE